MPTQQERQDQLDEIRAQRAAVQSQYDALNDEHQQKQSGLAVLPPAFQHADRAKFLSALGPLKAHDRYLHQQETQLQADINKADRDQKYQATATQQAAKQALATQKVQDAAQKQALGQVDDNLRQSFGLPKGTGLATINNQGFYDPARGQIGIPTTDKAAKAVKDAKGDPKAYAQVKDELA